MPEAVKLVEALQPGKPRVAPGMIPDSAVELLSKYVMFSVGPLRAVGIPPSVAITAAFRKLLREEWAIEGREWPWTPMGRYPWNSNIARQVYGALYGQLAPLSVKERARWGDVGIQKRFAVIADSALPGYKTLHRLTAAELEDEQLKLTVEGRFFEQVARTREYTDSMFVWFCYRALASMLYAVMQALYRVNISSTNAYGLVLHEGLSARQSATLNKAVIQLAGTAWADLSHKIGDIFTGEERRAFEEVERERQFRIRQEWTEFQAKQAALKKRIASLEDYQRVLQSLKSPLDAVRKGAGILADIVSFLATIPAPILIGAGGLAIYGLVIKPALE